MQVDSSNWSGLKKTYGERNVIVNALLRKKEDRSEWVWWLTSLLDSTQLNQKLSFRLFCIIWKSAILARNKSKLAELGSFWLDTRIKASRNLTTSKKHAWLCPLLHKLWSCARLIFDSFFEPAMYHRFQWWQWFLQSFHNWSPAWVWFSNLMNNLWSD